MFFKKWGKELAPNPQFKSYLKKELKINFKNIGLYETAFVHKSLTHEQGLANNERLEFLGDAILDAVVSELLFNQYPNASEGELTKVRSKIVSRKTLEAVAKGLSIEKWVKKGKGLSEGSNSIYGNALEALIGTVYLDKGYKAATKFVEDKIINNQIVVKRLEQKTYDFKSQLLEWGQKQKCKIDFEHIEQVTESLPFLTTLKINGKNTAQGQGTSKKRAEQMASELVLEKIANGATF